MCDVYRFSKRNVVEQTRSAQKPHAERASNSAPMYSAKKIRTASNLKSLLFFLAFLAAAMAVMLIAPYALGRALTGAEFAAIALPIGAALARLSLLARKRQRQKIEEMRDSALW